MSAYVTKILRVHGTDHPELAELHELFHKLKQELEVHTTKEEQKVFPAILQYEQAPTPDSLAQLHKELLELEGEHEGAGDILFRMREITNDYTPQKAHA
ncbi:hemerythrin domain-containing protein [Ammoniphilus sp. 3BR4]|uniref:hemerythrin domain-containing protein n=1 Tax=Ammoniphilus sp. 3BR4 TaxID=3158265 RepID=UPI0034650F10